jgi:hypothetical protein
MSVHYIESLNLMSLKDPNLEVLIHKIFEVDLSSGAASDGSISGCDTIDDFKL